MASETKKDNIFGKEENVSSHVKEVIGSITTRSPENIISEYTFLSKSYEELLGQTKLVTSVSDRLQGKLNKAYDKIQKINSDCFSVISSEEKSSNRMTVTIATKS